MTGPTITDLAPEIAAGRRRAERLTEEALGTIAALQPSLNAFITVTGDQALADAREADKEIAAGRYRGPLHGIPISLKDLIDVAGVATTAASRLREGSIAQHDAPIVRHLRDAGAVIVGKTNLHEFAFGTTNEDSGWGPAANPVDPARSPGGSSGGSAAAVRSGMCVASVGTDTGGSIRIPAAACGIVGLKPQWGEISSDGVVPLSRTLDHVGPLARSVSDAALLYDVLRGVARAERRTAEPSPAKLSFAALTDFDQRVSDEVAAGLRAAYDVLRRAGVTISPASLPHAADIAPIYLHIVLAEAAAYHASALDRRPEGYTPHVRMRLEMARYVLAEDYVRALNGREVIVHDVERALDGVDALLLPSLAIEAPRIGVPMVRVGATDEPVRNVMLRCTQPFNVSRHPAISVPCGTSSAGLPIGLQIVGHLGKTRELIVVAAAIERALAEAGIA